MEKASSAVPVVGRSPGMRRLAGEIRAARGSVTQVELARRLGRPQSVVSSWESGGTRPSLDTLAAIEKALGLVRGTFVVRAGFVDRGVPELGTETFERTIRCADRDEALEAVQAGTVLGFEVALTRIESQAGLDGDGFWLVTISTDAPPPA